MNYWTRISVEFANQRNYLDELYRVYPIVPNIRREIDGTIWGNIERSYLDQDDVLMVKELLRLDLFPIKDSYVAYLKRDPSSIDRNPSTIARIAGNLYSMDLSDIYEKCSEPKETNRQMGPMFKNWINRNTLGGRVTDSPDVILNSNDNCILNASDAVMQNFASDFLGYTRDKGIDFIAKYNGKYVVAEAKFLTDFGGHQNAQFSDAISTMNSGFDGSVIGAEVIPISILDGVLFIESNNKMYRHLLENDNDIIISALVLREFLFSI